MNSHFLRNAIIISYMVLLISRFHFHHINWEKFGIIKMLNQAIYKVLFLRRCLHEISFREKWNMFILMFSPFLITVYLIQPEMKLIADVISLWTFWQKWNFILCHKISCKHYLKLNQVKVKICTCVNKNNWLLLNGPLISDYLEIKFVSFRPQWK